jgi:hypothetical protein
VETKHSGAKIHRNHRLRVSYTCFEIPIKQFYTAAVCNVGQKDEFWNLSANSAFSPTGGTCICNITLEKSKKNNQEKSLWSLNNDSLSA